MPAMSSYKDDDDVFEEDIVFDQSGLLGARRKAKNSPVVRVKRGKCFLFAKTGALCAAFFVLGLCVAIPGPTLLEFMEQLQTDVLHVSYIYPARSGGYLIGSILGGFFFDRYNQQFLVFLSLLGTAAAVIAAPWAKVLWALNICMVCMGLTMGFLDTGGNVLCLDLWGRNSGPFMQALHFSFGFGAFVAPLLSQPFLGQTYDVANSYNKSRPLSRGKRDVLNVTEIVLSTVVPELSTPLENNTVIEMVNNNATYEFLNVSESTFEETTFVFSDINVTSTTVKPRTPKPKPKFTDAQKLDKSKDWDKIPFRKPSQKELILPSPTTPTTSVQPPTQNVTVITQDLLNNIFNSSDDNETVASNTVTQENSVTHNVTFDDVLNATLEVRTESNSTPIVVNQDIVTNSVLEDSTFESTTLSVLSSSTSTEATTLNTPEVLPITKTSVVPVIETTLGTTVSTTALTSTTSSTTEAVTSDTVPLLEAINDNPTEIATILISTEESYWEKSRKEHEKNKNTGNKKDEELSNLTFQPTESPHKNVTHIKQKPGTFDNDTDDVNTFLHKVAKKVESYGFSKFQIAYLIVGILVLLVALLFLILLCTNPRDPKSKQDDSGAADKKANPKWFKFMLVFLMFCFYFLYVGMEVAFGQLILTYSVHCDLHLSKSKGTYLTAMFWGSFASARFFAIFCASSLTPMTMLMLDFTCCTAGTFVLSLFGNRSETALWIGCLLVGAGMASIFPAGMVWAERYIHITNKVAAIFVVGAALGEMLCPIFITFFIVQYPTVLLHSVTVSNLLCVITFLFLRRLANKQGEKSSIPKGGGYQLASQHDDDDDMMIEMSPASNSSRLSIQNNNALLNGHFP